MTTKMMRKSMMVAAAVAGSLMVARSANAALTLTISEIGPNAPSQPLVVPDSGNTGSVSYSGSYGDFSTTLDFGFTNQVTGSGTQATMEITSIDITNNALNSSTPATLVLTLTDPGFTFPGSTGTIMQLGSAIGGTFTPPVSGEGVTFQSFETTTNATTGPQNFTVASQSPLTGSFNLSATPVAFVRGSTYGLESITDITLVGGSAVSDISGTTSVISTNTQVPEPATLGLVALAASGMLTRRSRRA